MTMTRLFYIVFAIILIINTSCKDNGLSNTPISNPGPGNFDYKISGLHDTSMERTASIRFLIQVERTSGNGEKVVLSGETLPEGMEVLFEPVSIDTASFNTTVLVKSERVKMGEHIINIKSVSPTTGVTNNFVKIQVIDYSNHAVGVEGLYTETASCVQQGNVEQDVNVEVDPAGDNKVIFKGLWSGVMTNKIKADINPGNSTVTIPSQVVNGVTFEGDGTYDDDKIIINYTAKASTINESCTSTLTRKKN